jgi:hypothetical protein
MFADPKKVAARRLKRRLKASASIALALVAGAFLACKGGTTVSEPAPDGPDARRGPGGVGDAPGPLEKPQPAPTAAAEAAPASVSSAMVVLDAGQDAAPDAHAPQVDKREHRKGMPVRDNLLE